MPHPDDLDPGEPDPTDELRRLWRATLELAERMQADGHPQAVLAEHAATLLAEALWAGIEAPSHPIDTPNQEAPDDHR